MRVVMAGLDDEPVPQDEDCWLHLTMGVDDLVSAGARVRRVVQASDAMSVAVLPGADESADAATAWLAIEDLLEQCGRAGAVVFLGEPLVRLLEGDGATDATELACALAESSGVVLLVVVAEQRVTAIKPDGRAEWMDRPAGPPTPGEPLCRAFLERYVDDPSDLGAAMGGAAETRG